MNNQDYESKKRECWEEYCQLHPKYVIPAPHFEFIFDRAYVLGKEKETITQEEIEKLSEEYSEEEMVNAYSWEWDSEYVQGLIESAWYEGANFALGKQDKEADTVIQGWAARDDGERWHERELHLFTHIKPERRKLMGDWSGCRSMTLDSDLFPDLAWDDDPQEVEIILKRKKK